MCFAPAPEVLDPPPEASGGDVKGRHGRPPEAKESPARSSRRILIRDEPKISLWAHGDTLQVAGYIVGAPGLGQGRREHVLRHHLHHALSYSVAEEQRCVRLLQHCLARGVLAVLRAACACQ